MPCPQLTEILHIGQNRESCCWTPSWQWWKASQTVTKVLDGNDWRMQQFELSAKTFKMWFSFYGGEMRKQRPTWWIESAMWFWRRVIHLRFLMNATSKGVATFRKWTNCCHPEVRRRSCGGCHDQRLFIIVLWVMTVVGLKQQFKVGTRLKGCRDTLAMKNSRRVQRWRVSASMLELEFIWVFSFPTPKTRSTPSLFIDSFEAHPQWPRFGLSSCDWEPLLDLPREQFHHDWSSGVMC